MCPFLFMADVQFWLHSYLKFLNIMSTSLCSLFSSVSDKLTLLPVTTVSLDTSSGLKRHRNKVSNVFQHYEKIKYPSIFFCNTESSYRCVWVSDVFLKIKRHATFI